MDKIPRCNCHPTLPRSIKTRKTRTWPISSHLDLTLGNDPYRLFSRDVTVAMLVSLNKGTAAMLVSPITPLGIEFYSYANVFFCFG